MATLTRQLAKLYTAGDAVEKEDEAADRPGRVSFCRGVSVTRSWMSRVSLVRMLSMNGCKRWVEKGSADHSRRSPSMDEGLKLLVTLTMSKRMPCTPWDTRMLAGRRPAAGIYKA